MAAGSLTGLCSLLVAMHFQVGLPWLLLSISGGQLLGVFGNWSHEFLWARPWLLPDLKCWDGDAARKIMHTGVMFLILTVGGIFTAPVDNIIISQILGPEAVTQYAVPMRLFLIIVSAITPLRSASLACLWRGDGATGCPVGQDDSGQFVAISVSFSLAQWFWVWRCSEK